MAVDDALVSYIRCELNLQGNNLEATTNPSKSTAPFS